MFGFFSHKQPAGITATTILIVVHQTKVDLLDLMSQGRKEKKLKDERQKDARTNPGGLMFLR